MLRRLRVDDLHSSTLRRFSKCRPESPAAEVLIKSGALRVTLETLGRSTWRSQLLAGEGAAALHELLGAVMREGQAWREVPTGRRAHGGRWGHVASFFVVFCVRVRIYAL